MQKFILATTLLTVNFIFSQNEEINGSLKVKNNLTITGNSNQYLHLRSKSGFGSYLYFAEQGVAERGILGYEPGSGDLIYKSKAFNLTNGTERFRIKENGNVGIGISNPKSKFVVKQGSYGVSIAASSIGFNRNVNGGDLFDTSKPAWQFNAETDKFRLSGFNGAEVNSFAILKNGMVGFGTTNPAARLHLNNNSTTQEFPSQESRGNIYQLFTNHNNTLEFGVAGARNSRKSWILSRHGDISGTFGKYYSTLHLQPDTGDKSQYRGIAIGYPANKHIPVGTHLAVDGNVSIGTLKTDGFKLSVDGKIRSTEVKVYTGWADFVFDNDYKLPTLTEVENHINEKGHLKDIPNANEVAQNGIYLGEMNSKLLQKIEELTLYTIAQEKEINSLKNQTEEISNLKKENELLKNSFKNLINRLEILETKK